MLLPFAAPVLASLFPSQHACPWQAAYHQAGSMPQGLQDVRACRTGVRARQERAVRGGFGWSFQTSQPAGERAAPLPCLRAPGTASRVRRSSGRGATSAATGAPVSELTLTCIQPAAPHRLRICGEPSHVVPSPRRASSDPPCSIAYAHRARWIARLGALAARDIIRRASRCNHPLPQVQETKRFGSAHDATLPTSTQRYPVPGAGRASEASACAPPAAAAPGLPRTRRWKLRVADLSGVWRPSTPASLGQRHQLWPCSPPVPPALSDLARRQGARAILGGGLVECGQPASACSRGTQLDYYILSLRAASAVARNPVRDSHEHGSSGSGNSNARPSAKHGEPCPACLHPACARPARFPNTLGIKISQAHGPLNRARGRV
ncbi:hypothetical protein ACCO45_009202 [Purpureocillium lilacinum]|uniref:Uncharacterized protein n=1 Tax=Purpureocillium lilacinum TaxID=33203 RepID=A0ACC4DJ11_PURLI